jgi:hypothetical protein
VGPPLLASRLVVAGANPRPGEARDPALGLPHVRTDRGHDYLSGMVSTALPPARAREAITRWIRVLARRWSRPERRCGPGSGRPAAGDARCGTARPAPPVTPALGPQPTLGQRRQHLRILRVSLAANYSAWLGVGHAAHSAAKCRQTRSSPFARAERPDWATGSVRRSSISRSDAADTAE